MKEKLIKDENNNGMPAYIVNMIKGNDFWLIVDGNGSIIKLDMNTLDTKEIAHFHSGKLKDLVVS